MKIIDSAQIYFDEKVLKIVLVTIFFAVCRNLDIILLFISRHICCVINM